MKTLCGVVMAIAMIPSVVLAADTKAKQKQEDRLENAGTVMDEVLNVPDGIPQALLDKAGAWWSCPRW